MANGRGKSKEQTGCSRIDNSDNKTKGQCCCCVDDSEVYSKDCCVRHNGGNGTLCIVVNDSITEKEFQQKIPFHKDFRYSRSGQKGLPRVLER